MSTAKIKLPLTISPQVQTHVRDCGLEPFFPAIIESFLQLFGEGRNKSVEVHHDPEAEGLKTVLFEVDMRWPSYGLAREARQEWHRRLYAVCPAANVCDVSLIIRRIGPK